MKKERILSYKMSQKLGQEEIESVSAAGGWTNYMTANATYHSGSGWDAGVDISWDF